MNETRRKPTTGRQSPSLFDKWHGIFYMPSRTDTAGHTKAFDYPVMGHWGKSRSVQFREWDSTWQCIGSQSNALTHWASPAPPARLPQPGSPSFLYIRGQGQIKKYLRIINSWGSIVFPYFLFSAIFQWTPVNTYGLHTLSQIYMNLKMILNVFDNKLWMI